MARRCVVEVEHVLKTVRVSCGQRCARKNALLDQRNERGVIHIHVRNVMALGKEGDGDERDAEAKLLEVSAHFARLCEGTQLLLRGVTVGAIQAVPQKRSRGAPWGAPAFVLARLGLERARQDYVIDCRGLLCVCGAAFR
jgi:hypothetical protein